MINNNLNTEGGSNLITLDMVVNSLVKKIEPNDSVDEQQLLALWNDERGKELLTPFQDDSILNRPTIAKELHAKLLISFIKKKFPEVE